MYQPTVDGSPNTEFIGENFFNPISHPVESLDAIFTVYKKKKGGRQNTPYLLYTEDLIKW